MQVVLEVLFHFLFEVIAYGIGRLLLLFTFGKVKAEPVGSTPKGSRGKFSYRKKGQLYLSTDVVSVLGAVFLIFLIIIVAMIKSSS